MTVKLQTLVSGRFKISAFREDSSGAEIPGSRRQLADFPNLVTDGGLERMATASDWLTFCRVGTGATAPAVTDTALATQVASASVLSSSTGTAATAPYYSFKTGTYRFAAGVAAGNLSEVGVGWLATVSGLFSRALILDSGGSPTTITVLSDEILDVTYQFRTYPPAADTAGSVTLDGVVYSYAGRAALVTSSSAWPVPMQAGGANTITVYDGAIGAVTGSPSGTSSSSPAPTVADVAYSSGSRIRSVTLTWGLTAGNLAGGIQSIKYNHGFACYQIQFTPKIPKDATKTLSLTVSHSWARKTI